MFVGTSGWRYAGWRGDFYPRGLVQRRELEHLASRLGSVELNGSYYSLQRPESYERWRNDTPPGFRFSVKGSRYVTHVTDPERLRQGMERFFDSGMTLLGDRLGPILWQLPARQRFDAERLERFLTLLPRRHDGRSLQHVLEPRHPSFQDPEALELLRRHRISLAVSDGAGSWPVFTESTGDVVYLRLHGPSELYHGGYSHAQLRHWASVARDLATADGREERPRDIYVYFDNDADGRAPWDALSMADTLAR